MSKKKGIITLVCVIAFLLAGTWTAVFGLDSANRRDRNRQIRFCIRH